MNKENNGWISVKEQMPKEFKTVLDDAIAEMRGLNNEKTV